MAVKGIIALDIDGTVTDHTHLIPKYVENFLSELADEGWVMIFITGRSFFFGYNAIKDCEFPYYYSAFNGAQMFQMPEKRLVKSHYLPASKISIIVEASRGVGLDPVFHDEHDLCYWRPSYQDKRTLTSMEERQAFTTEKWIELENFQEIGRKRLAYAKIFGPREVLLDIKLDDLATVVIQDPLRKGHALMLITHPSATKGGSLRDMKEIVGVPVPVIAAGDDYNDLTMIEEADIGIFMDKAPEELKTIADLTSDEIVGGLQEAIRRVIGE